MPSNVVISIVDDDESFREAMISLMKSVGYITNAFDSGESFLNSEHRGHTACLIADVQMPGMTGFDLYGRLIASGKPIPTILITAHPDERARARAIDAGVICYMAKPFNEADLIACIDRAVDKTKID